MSRRGQNERIVIGLHSCQEALAVHLNDIQAIYIDESKEKELRSLEWLKRAEKHCSIQKRKRSFFQELGSGHQGLAVVLPQGLPELNESVFEKEQSTLVALDEVEDPTNLGNILRTTWLLGVDGIFIPKDRSVKLTPTVCKIASGGAEHIPLEVSHPFDQNLIALKEKGYWVYGLDANATDSVYDLDFAKKSIIVAGNEGKGLRKSTQKACDVLVKIPQTCSHASLNVSTSLAVTLSHVQRSFFSG